jgi:hypothetical protein
LDAVHFAAGQFGVSIETTWLESPTIEAQPESQNVPKAIKKIIRMLASSFER